MHSQTNTHMIRTTRAFAVGTLVESLYLVAAGISQRLQDRRSLRPLRSMSDHELKDIGLNRGDVERELHKTSFWRIGG